MSTPMERLTAVVNDPKYKEFADELALLRHSFFDNTIIFSHLNGVAIIMPRLKEAVEQVQELVALPPPPGIESPLED